MEIHKEAALLDEFLMRKGVIKEYMFSTMVLSHPHESLEDCGNLMKLMSDDIVAACFDAGMPSWPLFMSSGLPKHMGYYFQTNQGPPHLSPKAGPAAAPVYCIETGEEFMSAAQAAGSIGCALPTMYAHLNGRAHSIYGKTYARIGEDRLPRIEKTPGRAPQRVRCVESGEEWGNATQAATSVGCAVLTMYAHLRRDLRYPKIGGRTYQYIQTGE